MLVRDSPLRFLHDSNLPTVVVHDWYIGIALDYLEASFYLLFQQWETEFRVTLHIGIVVLFCSLLFHAYRKKEPTSSK